MSLLSKKQLEQLRDAVLLFLCIPLLCFPGGFIIAAEADGLQALLSGFLSVGFAHSFMKLGPLPAWMRTGILLPIACSAPLVLLVLPHPLTVIWLGIPFALLVLSFEKLLIRIRPFVLKIVLCISLSLHARLLLHLLNTRTHFGLPYLPHHTELWLICLALIPLGFATRERLRPFAVRMAATGLGILMCCAGAYPLLWSAASSFKLPGEPEQAFHRLMPQERYFLLPKSGRPDLTPSELRKDSEYPYILHVLNEMTWRLTDRHLSGAFPAADTISPPDKVRSMKLYGFLKDDSHGNFLPGTSFTREPPPEMNPVYLEEFRSAMEQILYGPEDLAAETPLDLRQSKQILHRMAELNLITGVGRHPGKYRMTPQARKPFANGLLPRQLIYLDRAAPDERSEMSVAEYETRYDLDVHRILKEFQQFESLGAVGRDTVWWWNQHLPFLLEDSLWSSTGISLLSMILALLAGRSFSPNLKNYSLAGLMAGGAVLLLQWPVFADESGFLHPSLRGIPAAVRIGAGLWLLRNLLDLDEPHCDRVCFFAVCTFLGSAVIPLTGNSPLAHHAAWSFMWTVPAVILLFLSLRPIRSRSAEFTPS